VSALDAAVKAYQNGRGEWPRKTTLQRIQALQKFIDGLRKCRDQIVDLVMWEICKTKEDAQKEVDRTIVYCQDTIQALKGLENKDSTFVTDSGITAQVLTLSPYCTPD
jgi:glyceraldehyde-3-phosphate dehydrogenase (NADP+)